MIDQLDINRQQRFLEIMSRMSAQSAMQYLAMLKSSTEAINQRHVDEAFKQRVQRWKEAVIR